MTDHATCPNCNEYDGLACEYHSGDYSQGMPEENFIISAWQCSKCQSVVLITTPRKK